MSLKDRIYQYLLKHHQWFHGEDIVKLCQKAGYEAETGRRRLRELVEAGKVETEPRKGKRTTSNWYRIRE